MCNARMWGEPDGLRCTLADTHDETAAGGHTYRSSAGSEVDDKHGAQGHG